MKYRFSNQDDVALLARMNAQLIRDEGDPKRLTTDQLERRMAAWLAEGYAAVLFEESGDAVGYALFKEEPDWVYLRHFFVVS